VGTEGGYVGDKRRLGEVVLCERIAFVGGDYAVRHSTGMKGIQEEMMMNGLSACEVLVHGYRGMISSRFPLTRRMAERVRLTWTTFEWYHDDMMIGDTSVS
jgi:hypothetical protein